MKDIVIYWLAFFHMTKFRLLAVGEDAKLKFAER